MRYSMPPPTTPVPRWEASQRAASPLQERVLEEKILTVMHHDTDLVVHCVAEGLNSSGTTKSPDVMDDQFFDSNS